MGHPGVELHNLHFERGPHRVESWFLQQIFKVIGPAPLRFTFPNGAEASPPGISPIATVVIRDRWTLAELIADPEMAFGEAYAEGRIQVQGDLVGALEAVYDSSPSGRAERSRYQCLTSAWMNWLQDNTPSGSRHNIHSHYDLGNEFYKLWLDAQLVYTCAYFPTPAASLETAQEAKLDYVCRKLELVPGETVVESGCGWGALALHMARHYKVSVKAFNISHEQILHARRRAVQEGLRGQVEFIEDDYRNVSGQFDAFVSVGMLEHVGIHHFAEFGEVIHRCIGHRGRGLLHFIGRSYKSDFSRWIRKRIFPGAYAPTLAEAMNVLEPYEYAVSDVENLRIHYAKTVEHWLERFEASSDQVSAMYGDWFQRAWRLYLAGSIAGFRAGTLQLFQITFAGARSAPTSWTRAPLYQDIHQPGAVTLWTHATS